MNIDIETLVNRMNYFDFNYQYSDDSRVYERAKREKESIVKELNNLQSHEMDIILNHTDGKPNVKKFIKTYLP